MIDTIRLIIGMVVVLLGAAFSFTKIFSKFPKINAKFLTRVGIFSSIAVLLYSIPFLNLSIPFFPSFLQIHLDEIPAFIAGFAYGPLSGLIVIVIKTIIKLPISTSAGIGELADLIYSFAFIMPACIIYQKRRNFKSAVIGLIISCIVQIIVASLLTTYVMLDIYSVIYPGLSKDVILELCKIANPNVNDLNISFILMVALPFNLLKDVLVITITLLIYKRLHKLIDEI